MIVRGTLFVCGLGVWREDWSLMNIGKRWRDRVGLWVQRGREMVDASLGIVFLYRRKGMTGMRILGEGGPDVIESNDNWELFAWIFAWLDWGFSNLAASIYRTTKMHAIVFLGTSFSTFELTPFETLLVR